MATPSHSRLRRSSPIASAATAAALVACHSVASGPAEKPPASVGDSGGIRADRDRGATRSPADAAAADAGSTATEAPLDWGTRPSGPGPLYSIVDGMCIHGRVFALENGAVFAYGMNAGAYSRGGATTAQIVGEDGLSPMSDGGFGKAFGFWAPAMIGGRAPDKLWAVVDVSSRVIEGTDLYTGGSQTSSWKVLLASGAKFGDAGNMPAGTQPVRRLFAAGPWGGGAVGFAERLQGQTSAGQSQEQWSFRVLGPDGTWADGAKVPGADLAKLAPGAAFARLEDGEVLGLADSGADKLVRWSPKRPVSDLKLPQPARGPVALRAGKTRAYLEVNRELWAYDGDKLVPAKVTARLQPGYTWAVAPDDTLYVVLANATLLTETRARGPADGEGTVTEEALPMAGILRGAEAGALWLVAAGKGPGGSDALFRRTSGKTPVSWEPVPLPAPPFGSELRGPQKVEGFTFLAPDDVLVNVRRVEKGPGWKEPEPFRAIYRTKRPREVMRCQDTRGSGTGVGLHPWPPAADETCRSPVVVLLSDGTPRPPKDYPNLRAKLRGKSDLGESIAFVNFDARGTSNLAALVPDLAKAKALAAIVSKSLDLRAEVVCGKPTPTRSFSYDVAKGTFAF